MYATSRITNIEYLLRDFAYTTFCFIQSVEKEPWRSTSTEKRGRSTESINSLKWERCRRAFPFKQWKRVWSWLLLWVISKTSFTCNFLRSLLSCWTRMPPSRSSCILSLRSFHIVVDSMTYGYHWDDKIALLLVEKND